MNFTSNAPLELIEASTYQIQGLIDSQSKDFAFKVSIASFEGFNSPLQREHFNEDYLETAKYPSSTFSGTILDDIDLNKEGTYEDVSVRGTFEVHGIKQDRDIYADIRVENGTITIMSDFLIPLADHEIKIPRVVRRKLATIIYVTLEVKMLPRS